jgi:hypothetical protein
MTVIFSICQPLFLLVWGGCPPRLGLELGHVALLFQFLGFDLPEQWLLIILGLSHKLNDRRLMCECPNLSDNMLRLIVGVNVDIAFFDCHLSVSLSVYVGRLPAPGGLADALLDKASDALGVPFRVVALVDESIDFGLLLLGRLIYLWGFSEDCPYCVSEIFSGV